MTTQNAISSRDYYFAAKSDVMAAIVLTTKKHFKIDAISGGDKNSVPGIALSDKADSNDVLVEFQDFRGYEIFSAMACKYSINLTFIKKAF